MLHCPSPFSLLPTPCFAAPGKNTFLRALLCSVGLRPVSRPHQESAPRVADTLKLIVSCQSVNTDSAQRRDFTLAGHASIGGSDGRAPLRSQPACTPFPVRGPAFRDRHHKSVDCSCAAAKRQAAPLERVTHVPSTPVAGADIPCSRALLHTGSLLQAVRSASSREH